MAFTIGLRFYKFFVHELNSSKPLKFKEGGELADPLSFTKPFLQAQAKFTDDEDAQRSWFLDEQDGAGDREYWAIARYGTYGFESRLVDRETLTSNYSRKVSDLEEIPLFVHFWAPNSGEFGIAAFQSFQGRSCVQLILNKLCLAFQEKYKGHRLRFVKVSPDAIAKSASYKAPIKKLTLVTSRTPKDKADLLTNGVHYSEYNYEVSLVAKKGRILGALSEVRESLKGHQKSSGLIHFDGNDFEQAKADIVVNGKRRTVGILGMSSDSGAMDVTDQVTIKNGHPTFDSISTVSNEIMGEIYELSL